MLRYFLFTVIANACLLAACSPVYNWRAVSLPQAELKLLMPCKPDQGRRMTPLAGLSVEMQMAGCEAGTALFVVTHVKLDEASLTVPALAEWKTAMLSNMQAQDVTLLPVLTPRAASATPQPVRLIAKGKRRDGSAVVAQGIWFARDAHLYHAVVYADKLNQDLVDSFFSGMELQ